MVDIYLSKKDMRDTKCFIFLIFVMIFYFCERFLWFWCVSSFLISLFDWYFFKGPITLVLREFSR